MESNKYKALFDANKELVNLIERRTKLIKLRQKTHQNLYNTSTAITKIEVELKEIVMELEKGISKKLGKIRKPRKKKQTEEDLKLIEEASNIDLKDLNGNKDEYKDIETEEEFGEGNPYEQ